MNHPPWLQSNSLWFQKLLYQLYSYFQPWLWLFTFPCSFILVSCCMLLFYKEATAKDESVHITRAVLSTSKADISSLLFQEFALIFFSVFIILFLTKKSSKQNIFLVFFCRWLDHKRSCLYVENWWSTCTIDSQFIFTRRL